MNLLENKLYYDDVRRLSFLPLPWEKLQDSNLLISGASGMIGSFLLDVLMEKNRTAGLNCHVYAMGRNTARLLDRFSSYEGDEHFIPFVHDVNEQIRGMGTDKLDYVLHLASNTHPVQYASDPIGTITANILGLRNMLEAACGGNAKRFLFASSNEIYGENRGDTELFTEDYCGYINCNTLRAGYPESKRCGEALCQAYSSQKGLDVVIARLTRTYGPTMLPSDTKAISQFLKKSIAGEDIILKSAGTQYYSYQYVADSVSGLLYVLLCGKNGEAYNIAEEHSDIRLKDLAQLIASYGNGKVVFELPDAVEAAGYSRATKARLDGRKLQALGWEPYYDIAQGVFRTLDILKSRSAKNL